MPHEVDDIFGFDGRSPRPCSDRAARLARAVTSVLRAQEDLDDAQQRVPDYTGQWSSSDYIASDQEAWYRAAEELEAALGLSDTPQVKSGSHMK